MSFLKTIWATIKPVVLNKYLLVLIVFLGFLLLFDNHNLIKRWNTNRNIKQLESEIKYYRNEIENNKARMKELQSNDADLEKFAREQYLMKKENEEIFIIEEE